ncbi:MAG: riboflavin synthase [Gemmatimonadales bacterium]
MFTGIVTAVGTVRQVERESDRLRLTIEAPYPDLEPGESIAVSGACLTVAERGAGWFRVDAVVTTRERTRFGEIVVGDRVNLERSLAVGDRCGGHVVLGHVDGVGVVRGVAAREDALLVDIEVPDDVAELSVPVGSIAVEGVSMTVNAVPEPGVIQISVIPYTREQTTLGSLEPGDRVHLEADIIGKYVRRLLESRQPA